MSTIERIIVTLIVVFFNLICLHFWIKGEERMFKRKCPYCKKYIDRDSNFCKFCGEETPNAKPKR